MNTALHHYARIGLVHHMLYPQCLEDPAAHVETLQQFALRPDIETFDCCLPYGDAAQAVLIRAIRACGKQELVFATHFFPLRKLSFTSVAPHEQAQIRMIVKDMVRQAAAIGATGFIFASGGPTPAEAKPAHRSAFTDFCHWLCAELKPHGITALLEPFDTTIDKRFLYGPTAECVALIESLRPEVDNLQIELDMAHLPLMGESFEQAIRTVAPYLKRVHLGNCVLRNKSDPRYGDTHPPMGYPGGEIDVQELTVILRLLAEVGFLRREQRGNLLVEMTPWPGKTVDETVADNFRRLNQAWQNA
jgi:sugar phosphate isomerase/epimerase